MLQKYRNRSFKTTSNMLVKSMTAIALAIVIVMAGLVSPAYADPRTKPQAARISSWIQTGSNPGGTVVLKAKGGIVCDSLDSLNIGDVLTGALLFNSTQMTVWMQPFQLPGFITKLVGFQVFIKLKPALIVSDGFAPYNFAYEAHPRLPNSSVLPGGGRYDGGQAFRRIRTKNIDKATYTFYTGRAVTQEVGTIPIENEIATGIFDNDGRSEFDFICKYK